MSSCEMCGKESEKLKEVRVEYVPMKVCTNCERYGTVEKKKHTPVVKRTFVQTKSVTSAYEFIVTNAGELIKDAREKKNMRQVDLARRMVFKESIIHQVESSHRKPTLAEARKFEEVLNITLIAKNTGKNDVELESTKTSGFTIGDLIKDKRIK